MDAALVYEAAMQDVSLLRRCTALLADDLYKRSGNDGILYYFQGIDRVRYYLTGYCEARNLQKLKETGEISSRNKKTTVSQEQYRRMLKNLYL